MGGSQESHIVPTRCGHNFLLIGAARLDIERKRGTNMAVSILPKKPAAKPAACSKKTKKTAAKRPAK